MSSAIALVSISGNAEISNPYASQRAQFRKYNANIPEDTSLALFVFHDL